MTKQQYLYEGGWITSPLPLHQQPWVIKSMKSFHTKQNKWRQKLCTVCHEVWPTSTCLYTDENTYVCTRCKRDKHEVKRYSAQNDMLPGEVPPCLHGLSQVEEMLIARACPIMCVYRKHGGQRGYKGHVLNLPQDIQGFLDKLPCNVQDLPVLLLRRTGEDNTHTDLRVRRDKVLNALQWLQQNNPFYTNITIDHVAVQQLPFDDIPAELIVAVENEEQDQDQMSHDELGGELGQVSRVHEQGDHDGEDQELQHEQEFELEPICGDEEQQEEHVYGNEDDSDDHGDHGDDDDLDDHGDGDEWCT